VVLVDGTLEAAVQWLAWPVNIGGQVHPGAVHIHIYTYIHTCQFFHIDMVYGTCVVLVDGILEEAVQWLPRPVTVS